MCVVWVWDLSTRTHAHLRYTYSSDLSLADPKHLDVYLMANKVSVILKNMHTNHSVPKSSGCGTSTLPRTTSPRTTSQAKVYSGDGFVVNKYDRVSQSSLALSAVLFPSRTHVARGHSCLISATLTHGQPSCKHKVPDPIATSSSSTHGGSTT